MAERFYHATGPIDGRLILKGDEAHHAAKVLRLGPGQFLEVFDGLGSAWRARIDSVSRREVVLSSLERLDQQQSLPFSITLATAAPKGDRLDWLVEKSVELGVDRLLLLNTSRSVADPGPAKLNRLSRRVIEACKQCGRNRLMTVQSGLPWSEFIESSDAALVRLIAHPGSLGTGSWPRLGVGDRVVVTVGPEGGFTDLEVAHAVRHGWTVVGLGPTILRVETAGLVACARLQACHP